MPLIPDNQGKFVFERTKRLIDIVLAGVALIALSPVLAIIAMLVRLEMGSPVLFRQTRIGINGTEFVILKFRTMRAPIKDENMLLTDAQRVTQLGAFLRKSSLDELPSLINIFIGDMTIVGPRPLLPLHVELFSPSQRIRYSVPPGLTGLAQVSGRQNLTFSQRADLDVLYVHKRSILLDLKLIFRTATMVFKGVGVETGQAFQDVDDIGIKEKITAAKNDGTENE